MAKEPEKSLRVNLNESRKKSDTASRQPSPKPAEPKKSDTKKKGS